MIKAGQRIAPGYKLKSRKAQGRFESLVRAARGFVLRWRSDASRQVYRFNPYGGELNIYDRKASWFWTALRRSASRPKFSAARRPRAPVHTCIRKPLERDFLSISDRRVVQRFYSFSLALFDEVIHIVLMFCCFFRNPNIFIENGVMRFWIWCDTIWELIRDRNLLYWFCITLLLVDKNFVWLFITLKIHWKHIYRAYIHCKFVVNYFCCSWQHAL